MAELGETSDPTVLVPGDPSGVDETAASMARYADLLGEAGAGLRRIDTREGWSGEAAERFQATFDALPHHWLRAGDAFHTAGTAVRRYAATLRWAQTQATEAIRLWNQAEAMSRNAAAEHERAAAHPLPAATSVGEPDAAGAGFVDAEGTRDGVGVRTILDKNGQVVTGHPTGGPGVIQNDVNGNPTN